MSNFMIRKVAVLGAGVMGSQIAAHCANANVPVILYDLADDDPARRNARVDAALADLARIEPAPLADPELVNGIEAANYDDDLARLSECDLVIEAIAEQRELKHALYTQVAPHLRRGAIFATNTSALPLHELVTGLPEALHGRFFGVHFFNPPRYMSLVELIALPDSDPILLDRLESWLTTRLGKDVLRAPDTPGFIANRIGVFSLLAVMHHSVRLDIDFDVADALTGTLVGRPRNATFRTADIVGLDTLTHIIDTLHACLADDPWHGFYAVPEWLERLVSAGALGHKRGQGVYRRDARGALEVCAADGRRWHRARGAIHPEVATLLALDDPLERLTALRKCAHPQAQLVWCSLRDVFHYCAVHLANIARTTRDVDLALRWGFGWEQGPFEAWQAMGWREVAEAIREDIESGATPVATPLPDWVFERAGAHAATASYNAARDRMDGRTALPVYVVRQLYPDRVAGESAPDPGETIWLNEGVRLWRRGDMDPRIAILSLRTRLGLIDEAVLDGMHEVVARAERDFDALVLWREAPFSVGVDLKHVLKVREEEGLDSVRTLLERFQQASIRLREAQLPVVAAVEGMALGGGCEFTLHASHRVLAFEARMGLVEAKVGLIPTAGGCAAFATRAAEYVRFARDGSVLPFIRQAFATLVNGRRSHCVPEALRLGFAQRGDDVVMHPRELLYVALRRARSMALAAYRPPLYPPPVVVAGREGMAVCAADFAADHPEADEHDHRVARALARVLCGGDVAAGSVLPEDELLALEREGFMELIAHQEAVARMADTLDSDTPSRI